MQKGYEEQDEHLLHGRIARVSAVYEVIRRDRAQREAFGGIVIELQHDVVEIGSNRDNSNQ